MTSQAIPVRAGALGGLAILVAAFVAGGALGVYRYARNYWLYRGFSPPEDPAWVAQRGTIEHVYVSSPALGGRHQGVYVYLPPGYFQHPRWRYPTFYLLHGFPGRPDAFVLTIRAGVLDDTLSEKGQIRPLILVMPM